MKSNTAQLAIAARDLGENCRTCCGMSNNCCAKFVCKGFSEAGNASLFYGGRTVTYVPSAQTWMRANLAEIPLYLAMPSDVLTFDWNLNGTPDHIGFVANRISDTEIHTLEGNTGSGIVMYRTRPYKYISGVWRPQFIPPSINTSKKLTVDGQFGYDSIAMLQKALGIKVDGILGKQTVKALQKKVGVAQDGAWGIKTSKAVQKMIGTSVDGWFGEKSVKALQTWINKNVTISSSGSSSKPNTPTKPTVTPSQTNGKLNVNGKGDANTIKAMQKFFGTAQDGFISGQIAKDMKAYAPSITAYKSGKGGSAVVRNLQRWVGVEQDGYIGINTVKAWQKKIGVAVDGCFGTASMKAWQKYLNTHDKAVYPKLTVQDKMCTWAKKICDSGKYHYKVFDDDPRTQQCPICHPGSGNGWNCIGYAFACWRHGGGLKCNCNCEVINNSLGDRMLNMSDADLLATVKSRVGLKDIKVIRNRSGIPTSQLKKGDLIMYYDGSTYEHMAMYIGDGKITDSARGHSPQVKYGVSINWCGYKVKIAIRYTGA